MFEDVTAASGIDRVGPSYAVAWGDVDGDGHPDLWLGNHADAPQLLRNQGDGRFEDVTAAWLDVGRYDAHGAVWVDLDGDGDLDLVELTGAQRSTGQLPHRAYLQQGGRLVESAARLGLDEPEGPGRCVVPTDVNHDGRIDLLMLHQGRKDGRAPTALYLQTPEGFRRDVQLPDAQVATTAICATAADVHGSAALELLTWGLPKHLAMLDPATLGPIEIEGLASSPGHPVDVLAGDVDGDARTDLVVLRDNHGSGYRLSDTQLAMFLSLDTLAQQGVRFRADGPVTMTVGSRNLWSATDVRLGSACEIPTALPAALPPSPPCSAAANRRGISAGQLPDGRWEVLARGGGFDRVWVVLTGQGIAAPEWVGWDPATEALPPSTRRDRLYLRTDKGLRSAGFAWGLKGPSHCRAGALADFDHDMDLDLYLVCSDELGNLPNRFFRNDGATLTEVDVGLAGSQEGRGDSVALADVNGDGALDVLLTHGRGADPLNEGPVQLFRNVGATGHWLMIELHGTAGGLGATVVVTTPDGRKQVRTKDGGVHAGAQHEGRLHVGLGPNERVQSVQVAWPDGSTERWSGVEADQVLHLTQGTAPSP